MEIQKGKQIIMIDKLAPAKKKGLYIGWETERGVRYYKVGNFNSDICAQEFEKVLRYFLDAEEKTDEQ